MGESQVRDTTAQEPPLGEGEVQHTKFLLILNWLKN